MNYTRILTSNLERGPKGTCTGENNNHFCLVVLCFYKALRQNVSHSSVKRVGEEYRLGQQEDTGSASEVQSSYTSVS